MLDRIFVAFIGHVTNIITIMIGMALVTGGGLLALLWPPIVYVFFSIALVWFLFILIIVIGIHLAIDEGNDGATIPGVEQ